jgi:hypothetical protein
MNGLARVWVVFLLSFGAWLGAGPVRAADAEASGVAVSLGDRIGPEIDADESARYGLFPDLPRFRSGHFETAGGGYRLVYTETEDGGARTKRRSITREAFQQTAWHVAFVDEHDADAVGGAIVAGIDTILAGAVREPDLLRRLTLRYAARRHYELARLLASDLREAHPSAPAAAWAVEAAPRLDALAGPHRALLWNGTLLDQRGRTDLIVFSGYYGLWLGIAIPAAMESEDAQAYAAGILAVPLATTLLAVNATRNGSMSRGHATMISLGGHFGTWQGLGWSGTTDAEGHEVLAAGIVGGVAGILLAVPATRTIGEGHAAVTNSAMYWGGWFGLVESVLTGREEDTENSPLIDMLVGSDVGLLVGAIGGREAKLTTGRMRLINLAGVLGTAFGGGFALLTESQDETAMAMLGGGSVLGLVLGTEWTKNYDRGKDLVDAGPARSVEPVLSMRASGRGRAGIPTAGLRVRF